MKILLGEEVRRLPNRMLLFYHLQIGRRGGDEGRQSRRQELCLLRLETMKTRKLLAVVGVNKSMEGLKRSWRQAVKKGGEFYSQNL